MLGVTTTDLTMDQWVIWVMSQMGHGSNGLTTLDGSRGSQVSTCDRLTHESLTDDSVNHISRTISITFGIRPINT